LGVLQSNDAFVRIPPEWHHSRLLGITFHMGDADEADSRILSVVNKLVFLCVSVSLNRPVSVNLRHSG